MSYYDDGDYELERTREELSRLRREQAANQRRGANEPTHLANPRPPPIYPPRRIRRRSTLPVRFEDETVPVRPVVIGSSRQYEVEEVPGLRAVRSRVREADSEASSENEAERRHPRRKNFVEVLAEPDPVGVEGVPAPSIRRVEEVRSRSPSLLVRARIKPARLEYLPNL